jgi:hypothetical protein
MFLRRRFGGREGYPFFASEVSFWDCPELAAMTIAVFPISVAAVLAQSTFDCAVDCPISIQAASKRQRAGADVLACTVSRIAAKKSSTVARKRPRALRRSQRHRDPESGHRMFSRDF